EYVSKNMPIGSGVIEAACKVIIKQRMCKSGMKWSDSGAKTVLLLRCFNETDGKWIQFWNKVMRYGTHSK
ncbi:MAG: ISKra4 family transposase, partial [Prevotellaceae bacterium]|nr:ISKra4 family transposase [Prevotellaceae bacterium]